MVKKGSPKIKLDNEQLETLMGYKPTSFDVSGFFKISRRTLQNYIHSEYGMTFIEFRETYLSKRKLSLIQLAIHRATDGKNNDMLKFCLINLAGWRNAFAVNNTSDEEPIDDIEWTE